MAAKTPEQILRRLSVHYPMVAALAPKEIRRPLIIGWANFKLLDGLEDSNIDREKKYVLMDAALDAFKTNNYDLLRPVLDELVEATGSGKDNVLFTNFEEIFKHYVSQDKGIQNLTIDALEEMNYGMKIFLNKPIVTFDNLNHYAHFASGTAAIFVDRLVQYTQRLREHSKSDKAEKFGQFVYRSRAASSFEGKPEFGSPALGMVPLTYFTGPSKFGRLIHLGDTIQDYKEDTDEKRYWWPSELGSHKELIDPNNVELRKNALEKMLANASVLKDDVVDYIDSVSHDYRKGFVLASLLSQKTANKQTEELFSRKISISPWSALAKYLEVRFAGYDVNKFKKEFGV